MSKNKCIIVLGMHRSATSLVAKGLHDAYVNMGDELLGSSSSNIEGHFEDVDFLRLNIDILNVAGGRWDYPPPETNIMQAGEYYSGRIEALIAEKKKNKKLWGWKDPRTTLTIRCYMPFLNKEDVIFVSCFRNPYTVAKSLEKRNNMRIDEGVKLAHIYNERLLKFLNEYIQYES